MNKRTVAILGGTVGVILTLGGCGGTTYEYKVSGTVSGQHVDIDCPKSKGVLSMEAVSFDTGKNKSKKSKSKGSSATGSKSAKPKSKVSKTAKTKTLGSTGSKASPKATTTKRPTQKTIQNVGVLLSEKPDKPEKLKSLSVPREKYTAFRKGCEREYEIFVLSGGHLYEQDVRKVDYNNCQRARAPKGRIYKLFPLCTKG
jgi:hypothetical protein